MDWLGPVTGRQR